MLNIKSILKEIFFMIVSASVVLILTSCPEPMTTTLVALVEDTISPTINISSPKGGDNYYSTVTVTGIISDDVQEENDESGQITSIYYEIANDDYRKGKIDIDLDDSITADEDFGSGTIDYDLTTREFSFTFSTISPTSLRDQLSLTITAIDRNSNETEYQLNLTESNGPVINFDFYNSSEFGEDDIITSLSTTKVYIGGTVGNSEIDEESADEIAEISWSIEGGGEHGGTLDVTDGSDDWNEEDGLFETSNNVDITKTFTYDPETRMFKTQTNLDVSDGTKYINVTATDIYGHTTEETNSISQPADLELYDNAIDDVYFSPHPDQTNNVTIPFRLIDPNKDEITSSRISNIICSMTSTISEDTYTDTNSDIYWYDNGSDTEHTYLYSTLDSGAGFTIDGTNNYIAYINITLDADTYFDALNGDVYITPTITNDEGEQVSADCRVYNDGDGPTIPTPTLSGGTNGYIGPSGQLTLNFNVSDDKSGVEASNNTLSSNIVVANINDSTTAAIPPDDTITFAENGNYSIDYTIPSDAESNSDGSGSDITYSVTFYDAVGNGTNVEDLSAKTLYGAYDSNSYTIDSNGSTSDNPVTNPDDSVTYWARATGSPAYDTVTVYFTSPRLLASTPTVTIGEQTASVTSQGGNATDGYSYKAVRTMDGTETTADLDFLPITVNSIDILGNPETLVTDTEVYYDGTAPSAPNTISYSGSYDADHINSADMDGTISMTVNYDLTDGASGDTVELHLGSASGTLLGDLAYNASSTSVDIELTSSGKTALGTDGSKSFYAVIVDPAGNISGSATSLSLTKDTAAPTWNTGSSDVNWGYIKADDTDSITVNASDSSGVVNSGIDSYVWTFSNNATITNAALNVSSIDAALSDGAYTAVCTATDGAGNTLDSGTLSFTLDTIAPAWTANVGSGTDWSYIGADSSNSITVAASDANTLTYTWTFSDASTTLTGATLTAAAIAGTSLSDSSYTVSCIASDPAGNASVSSNDLSFTLDQDDPTWSDNVTSGTDWGAINGSGSNEITVSATDGNGIKSYTWTFSDASSTTLSGATLTESAIAGTSLTDGSYTVSCIARDNADNPTPESNSLSFTLDTSAPEIPSGDLSFSKTSNTGYTYAREGDTINLSFTVTDATEVDTAATSIAIFGEVITDAVLGGTATSRTYTKTGYTIPDADTSGSDDIVNSATGTSFGYEIECDDTLGNGPVTSNDTGALIFYSPYVSNSSYFYSSTPTVENSDTTNSSWASIGDTITVTFTGVRDLYEDPTVTICGQTPTTFSYISDTGDAEYKKCTATYDIPSGGISGMSQGDDIYFTISETDKAGQSSGDFTYTSTTIDYDEAVPTAPTTVERTSVANYDAGTVDQTDMGNTLTFKISYANGSAIAGDTVELYLDATTDTLLGSAGYDAATNDYVTINVTDNDLLGDDGSKTLYAVISDPAGNISTSSPTLTLTKDTIEDAVISEGGGATYTDAFTLSCSTSYSDLGTYAWTITDNYDSSTAGTGSGSSFIVRTNTSGDLQLLTDGTDDGEYGVELIVTDSIGNISTATTTFIWDGDNNGVTTRSLSINTTTAPTLLSGNTSGSSGSSASSNATSSSTSRIKTYNFDSNSNPASIETVQNSSSSSSTTGIRRTTSYSGGLFSSKTSAPENTDTASSAGVKEETSATTEGDSQFVSDNSIADAAITDEAPHLKSDSSNIVNAATSAATSITPAASSEVINTVSAESSAERSGNRSALLLLLIPGGAATGILIFRKRRL